MNYWCNTIQKFSNELITGDFNLNHIDFLHLLLIHPIMSNDILKFYDHKAIPLHIIIVIFWSTYLGKYFQCFKRFWEQKNIIYTFDDQEWFKRFTFAIVIIGCGNTLTNTCVFYYYVPYITSGYWILLLLTLHNFTFCRQKNFKPKKTKGARFFIE